MNDDRKRNIRRILEIACALLAVLCGLSYAIAAIYLYKSGGDTPYTAESVGRALLYLLPISILTLISIISSGVLSVIWSEQAPRLRGSTDTRAVLGKLYRRYRISAVDMHSIGHGDMALITDPDNYSKIAREGKRRAIARLVFALLCLTVICGALIPLLSPSSYDPSSSMLNATVIKLVLWSLTPTAVLIGGSLMLSDLTDKSYRAELEAVKSIIASSSPADAPITKLSDKDLRQKLYTGIRITVIVAAVSLITVGIVTGDVENIIDKAIRICQECIGLG